MYIVYIIFPTRIYFAQLYSHRIGSTHTQSYLYYFIHDNIWLAVGVGDRRPSRPFHTCDRGLTHIIIIT